MDALFIVSRTPVGFTILIGFLAVSLLISVLFATTVGPADIPISRAWLIILHHVWPGLVTPDWPAAHDGIVWEIRLPRALLAAVVGGIFAILGAVLQTMVRNPLADPTLIGGAAGASVGAVGSILLGWTILGLYSVSIAAFLGALGGYGLVYMIAQRSGRLSPLRLVLAGIIVTYLLGAVASLMVFTSEESGNAVRSALFWTLGSLAGARWEKLIPPTVLLLFGMGVLLLRARPLNALLFGEETAATLGVSPDRSRRLLFVLVALLTGTAVAAAGGIGFIGLVMPHIARIFVGADHTRVLPLSVLLGAVSLVWADVLARTVAQPGELPIGILTALIGAPVFAWLLNRRIREAEMGS